MTPEQLRTIDAMTRRHLGKPLTECSAADLRTAADMEDAAAAAELAGRRARIDQIRAVAADARGCGCPIRTDVVDGRPDPWTARVAHRCDR